MKNIRVELFVCLVLLVMGLSVGAEEAKATSEDVNVRKSFVAFDAVGVDDPWTIAGELRIPQTEQETYPAVLIVHGSNGVDTRGVYHAQSLNNNGIVTLEIDLWAARGNFSGAGKRPRGVPETLPDAFGALAFLAKLSFVDADRIGVMGFSWGGVVTMLSATTPYNEKLAPDKLSFSAHVAFYPICWGYNLIPGYEFSDLTGAPVLILAGALDTYDSPTSATDLVAALSKDNKKLVSAHVYPNATHGWNMQGDVDMTINDPFAHKGRGGEVRFLSDSEVADDSRIRTDAFFRKAFGIED